MAFTPRFEINKQIILGGGFLDWEASCQFDMDLLSPEYDARSRYPEIVSVAATWDLNGQFATNPIVPGAVVQGFYYFASVLDNSPKYYFYETKEDGYAVYTGIVAAVGQTEEGLVATSNETWDSVKALFR